MRCIFAKVNTEGKNLSISLLKIDGTDARNLAEIKRRRICDTLSIYFGVATTQMPAYLQKTDLTKREG